MTLANKRWTRQPYSSIYANQGTYFEKEFMECAMNRWEEIKLQKNIQVKPYNGKGEHILITCNRGTEGYSAEKKCNRICYRNNRRNKTILKTTYYC